MRKLLGGSLIVAATVLLVSAADQLPYSQNIVVQTTFDPQGAWTLTGVAAESATCSLSHLRKHRLLGTELLIKGRHVKFAKASGAGVEPLITPILGQETYDTRSKEFWLDFQTDPKQLDLPRYVSAVNVELGTVIAASNKRFFFVYGGVWFKVSRAGGNASHSL